MLSVHKKEMSVKQPTAKKTTTTRKTTSSSNGAPIKKTAAPPPKKTVKKPSSSTTPTQNQKAEESSKKKTTKTRTRSSSGSSTSSKKSENQKKTSTTKKSKDVNKSKEEFTAPATNSKEGIETAVSIEKLSMKPPKPAEQQQQQKNTKTKELPKTNLRHQDSIGLYQDGWKPGQHLVVTKSSTEVTPAESRKNPNRPIFHLPLNLNDSTASFQGTSQGYLEMSSGLLPFQPKNKYNFRISLDDTNDMSQTANMLRNCIFDENNQWDSNRTGSSHILKNQQQQQQQQISLPEGFDEKDSSFIIPSTETTNRSFNNHGRTSTRLSFLYNKSTGLLCKNCFSSSCDHMDKFNTLATPKLKKVFRNSSSMDRLEANSSDVSQKNFSFDNFVDEQQEQQQDERENMRLVEINDFYHHDVSSGERVPFREISMEYEEQEIMKFETSTPNGDEGDDILQGDKSSTSQNNLNMSGSMLRYTPGIMGDNLGYQQQPQQQQFTEQRPRTNDSLKYDSDYDDDNYLAACQTSSANSTFETLDVNSGVFFSNIEHQEDQDAPIQSSTPTQNIYQQQPQPQQQQQNTSSSDNRKIKGRRKSLITMPDLPTVFEEKSAPNTAFPDDNKSHDEDQQHFQEEEFQQDGVGIQEILETVTGSLASMFDDVSREVIDDVNDGDTRNESESDEKNVMEQDDQLDLKDSLEDEDDGDDKDRSQQVDSPSTTTAAAAATTSTTTTTTTQNQGEDKAERMTPLESQGIFRRIQNEEEEGTRTPIKDEDLQAVLQENRKHTFERQYFYAAEKNDDSAQLDEMDREVLEINTPQWADKQPESMKESKDISDVASTTDPQKETTKKDSKTSTSSKKHESKKQQVKQPTLVDASTQADDLPFSPPKPPTALPTRTPQTGDSSDTLETQGSYRKIDLLVLDHGRRQNHALHDIAIQQIADNPVIESRDADSGVHSDHTAQSSAHSEAGIMNIQQQQQQQQQHNDIAAIADNANNLQEFDRESMSNVSTQNNIRDDFETRYSPRGSFYADRSPQRNMYNHVTNHMTSQHSRGIAYDDERVLLPAIDNPYFSPLSNENDLYFSEAYNNRLVYNRRLASPYYSSDFGDRDLYEPRHRDTVSPMLEHHLRMAHYHRERVALLTPLYSTSSSNARRHIPEPHLPQPPIESQHNISRTYKRRYSSTRNMFYENRKPDYLETLSDISPRSSLPFPPHPPSCHSDQSKSRRISANEHHTEANSKWQRKNKIGTYSRNRKVDNEHDLYLTTPYRSIFRK